MALLLAVSIALLLLPYLNSIAAKELSFSIKQHPFLFPLLLGITILVGVLAGIYPAFYLSRFKPIEVLKGKVSTGFKKSYLRSSLVVFQFFVSIVLIIATIVIYRQLTFMQNKKLGFNKEQVIHIKDAYLLGKNAEVFKQEVLKHSEIISGSRSGYLPVSNSSRSSESLFPEGQIENDKAATSQLWRVDHDYIKTFGIELAQGRDFNNAMLTDSNAMIINEAAVRIFGFGSNPIGRKITEITDIEKKTTKDYIVIGVVKNFNYESLRQNIGALCMKLQSDNTVISFCLKGGDIKHSIGLIQSTWKKIAPNEPFTYSFLNEEFDDMYRSEQRIGNVFISFAVLAILIACLGLFGLVSYAAEQRTKEIGIRKILGATVSNIVGMLSKDFLKLVLIASFIAFPVAWWAMHTWLQNFAYRIDINWWIFAVAAAVSVVIALITISFQAIKAAIVNPTKSLKSD
jgi:putative ABC transport system permease protein